MQFISIDMFFVRARLMHLKKKQKIQQTKSNFDIQN